MTETRTRNSRILRILLNVFEYIGYLASQLIGTHLNLSEICSDLVVLCRCRDCKAKQCHYSNSYHELKIEFWLLNIKHDSFSPQQQNLFLYQLQSLPMNNIKNKISSSEAFLKTIYYLNHISIENNICVLLKLKLLSILRKYSIFASKYSSLK